MKSSRRNIICICHRRFVTKYTACHLSIAFFSPLNIVATEHAMQCASERRQLVTFDCRSARKEISRNTKFMYRPIDWRLNYCRMKFESVELVEHGPQKAINEFIEKLREEEASAVAIIEWTTTTEELITTTWMYSKTGCKRTHSHTNITENLIRGTMEKQ